MFSKHYNNPMLWGHYSERLSGICLEFDVEYDKDKQMNYPEFLNNNTYRYLSKINYIPNTEKKTYDGVQFVNNGEASIPGEDFKDLLFTKSYHWEHEKEWRLLIRKPEPEPDPVSELYFLPFDHRIALRKILIGPHCPNREGMKSRLGRLVADCPDPPKIFFTELSPSTFEIKKVT